jgi:hypothetical protein
MIDAELIEEDSILKVSPRTALEVPDFQRLASLVDLHIERHGRLNGIMIQLEELPGWDNFYAMLEHFNFIKQHHDKVRRVAVVTDSTVASFLPNLMDSFVSAEVKHFAYQDSEQALAWLKAAPQGS